MNDRLEIASRMLPEYMRLTAEKAFTPQENKPLIRYALETADALIKAERESRAKIDPADRDARIAQMAAEWEELRRKLADAESNAMNHSDPRKGL